MSGQPTSEFAVILAGGGGTRLWPASRRTRPKQLLTLGGPESLIAAAVRRAEAVVGRERVLVVTAADQEAAIRAALPDLARRQILAEPQPRNTAPAVGLAAAWALATTGPEAVLAVLPADAFIGDEPAFARTLRTALDHAHEAIVTVGLRPGHPETGFGYVRTGGPAGGRGDGVQTVAAFVEKPDRSTAERYLASGDYLWNSGMFFLTAGQMLAQCRRYLPRLARFLDAATTADGGDAFAAEVARHYQDVEAISIDYGIMERVSKDGAAEIRVVPGDFGWNDVGSWSALADIRPHDGQGNVAVGDVVLAQASGNVVVSEPGAPLVSVVGATGLVVVATRDAVLVVPKDRAQDVRLAVEALRAAGRTELL